jgi:hypothetical protein
VLHEALCVLTGMMPIELKIEQAARIYQLTKGNDKDKALFDKDMEVRYWQHPAEASISSTEQKEEKDTIQIYTDGSKTDKGVGSGIAIFESGKYIESIQHRLNEKCTNNRAEQLAILAALQYMYVCMYACMHACMHVCMYVCMHVCMYVRMYVCTYVSTYVHMYVRT